MNKQFMEQKIILGTQLYTTVQPIIRKKFEKDLNIFLIGKAIDAEKSIRGEIYIKIKDHVKVHFPEHIFKDQMYLDNYDLLSLENLLANSVDSIVMCIESPGSIAELGAFTNHFPLNQKLIVYMDESRKANESFINLGPIKYLKKTKSKVVWINTNDDFEVHKVQLFSMIREMKKKTQMTFDLNNLFFAENYIIVLLYIMKSLSRKEIIEVIKNIGKNGEMKRKEIEIYITVVDSAIGMLLFNEEIYRDENEYYLTNKGFKRLKDEFPSKVIHENLDKLRLTVLNLQLRKYWGY